MKNIMVLKSFDCPYCARIRIVSFAFTNTDLINADEGDPRINSIETWFSNWYNFLPFGIIDGQFISSSRSLDYMYIILKED